MSGGPGNPEKGAENLRRVSVEQRRRAGKLGGDSNARHWRKRHAERLARIEAEYAPHIQGYWQMSIREKADALAQLINQTDSRGVSAETFRKILSPRKIRANNFIPLERRRRG
jgi:hypothetical protein